MANAGFFEQESASPTRFALVVGAHALLLGAVMMAAGPQFIRHREPPTVITPIAVPEPPPPEVMQRRESTPSPLPPIPSPDRIVDTPQRTLIGVQAADLEPVRDPVIPQIDPVPIPDPPAPVRTDAQFDQRYAEALRPPYPLTEQRAQRSGTVVIRVTIGMDGRVRAAERVSATSDAFWAAAERQALTRWRFRPASVDGRPVESTRTMTLHFRIEDV